MPMMVKEDLAKTPEGSKAKADQDLLAMDIAKTVKQIESMEQMIKKLKPILDKLPEVEGDLAKADKKGGGGWGLKLLKGQGVLNCLRCRSLIEE